MSVVAEQQRPDLREPKGWRRASNRIATSLMVLAFVLVPRLRRPGSGTPTPTPRPAET